MKAGGVYQGKEEARCIAGTSQLAVQAAALLNNSGKKGGVRIKQQPEWEHRMRNRGTRPG